MAGRKLRETIKETLISNGNGKFDNNIEVVIAGLTNIYSQYVSTFEEYKQQRYEIRVTCTQKIYLVHLGYAKVLIK